MNTRIIDEVPSIINRLNENQNKRFSAFVGFDACIDIIARVVSGKNENNTTAYFANSRDFSEFILNLGSRSCGVELQTKLTKAGGNMVITGNALGNLGISVDCMGTFGLPGVQPIFHSMSPDCKLITIGDTITATALEFNNSKIILFDPGPYNDLTWNGIKDKIGIDRLREFISGKQLVSFLNWSEIENTSLIWKGFLEEVFPFIPEGDHKPLFFTDFSDCSRRSAEEIKLAIVLLGRFREFFKVVMSLNTNEANLISSALDLSKSESEEEFVKTLFKSANVDILTIHHVEHAVVYDGINYDTCNTFICNNPLVLTGGGDNFNAGFCFSLFNGLDLFQTLLIANAVSGFYVKTGISPSGDQLKEFLKGG